MSKYVESDHDEEQCDNLHEDLSYSIHVFNITKGAKDFKKWFETAFNKVNPNMAEQFEFSFKPDPDTEEEKLEIFNHFPDIFSTHSLIIMWRSMIAIVDKTDLKQDNKHFN
jgi:hypothetical protein